MYKKEMAEHTNTTVGPYKGMKRSDCERTERTMGNVPMPFVPADSQLLNTECVKFKLKDTPSKRGTGEFTIEVNRLENQSSVADYLTWKEKRVLVFAHKPASTPIEKFINAELILGGEVLGLCKVKKHQAVNQETPSENDIDEEGHAAIVKRGITLEAFDTCDREFEKLFIKASYARDQRTCMRYNILANVKLNVRDTASRSQQLDKCFFTCTLLIGALLCVCADLGRAVSCSSSGSAPENAFDIDEQTAPMFFTE